MVMVTLPVCATRSHFRTVAKKEPLAKGLFYDGVVSVSIEEPRVPPLSRQRQIMNKDSQMRAAINQKLIEMGERERLKELLRAKLVECGWKDQLKAHCKDVIREKGLEHVTVEDLVTEVTPKGRALVPDSVKKELLQRIRAFLAQHATL
ncbi:hypothetical protein LDENG_00062170 [Lucifuga dentata]|nr:hypothetical protein LDENG_00062170 [Lucifuga dentata]